MDQRIPSSPVEKSGFRWYCPRPLAQFEKDKSSAAINTGDIGFSVCQCKELKLPQCQAGKDAHCSQRFHLPGDCQGTLQI
ncbi:hypothetical protein XELAEV_18041472mg [Xenopus laevis]|uniref:Uncharacterized protein n=1 Tax=Xenopus laevis TaxID=8355 RepID=A0A974C285_XENLA|nr:hypothetical protein XELAEV_18041472mg [Xenopus laevis]